MKIYTGFGDQGNTALLGGQIVKKNNPRIETYGVLDELNSMLGLILSKHPDESIESMLKSIQEDIFIFSAEIATPDKNKQSNLNKKITNQNVKNLESHIDMLSSELDPLKNFIIPGGSEEAAIAHIARTICRRAERNLVALMSESQIREDLLIYINRLSDLLFVLARYINKSKGEPDLIWKS